MCPQNSDLIQRSASRDSLNNLDELMAKCGFSVDENNSENAFAIAYDLLTPYLGERCIWMGKQYVLDEALIKQYLAETFYFVDEASGEADIQEESPNWVSLLNTVFIQGLAQDRLDLIKKISSAEWDEIFIKNSRATFFLLHVLIHQPLQVTLALINKVSSSALKQTFARLSADQLNTVLKIKSTLAYKQLLKKIDHIPDIPLSPKTKRAIYAKKFGLSPFKLSKFINLFIHPFETISVGIKNSILEIKARGLTGALKNLFLYQSPEVLIEFIAKLPKEQISEIVLPLDLPELEKRLPYFLLSKSSNLASSRAFYSYLKAYQPLTDKLISHYDPLLSNCIDFYFEGKGDIAPELRPLFIKGLQAKISLSKKTKAFLEVLQDAIPTTSVYAVSDSEMPSISNTVYLNPDPQTIWRYGVLSWHYYRQLRMQSYNILLQSVLDQLSRADLLFTGSRAAFSDFFSDNTPAVNTIRNDYDAVQRALICIQEFKGLIKIIKPKDWQFFVEQLENLDRRPKLRNAIDTPTYKYVHLEDKVVPYQKKRRQKTNYTHTKKTSTTLLSPQMATSVFGENAANARLLVGILFDQEQCAIKAMLLKDSGTVEHAWLGNKDQVSDYKRLITNVNQTDWNLFAKEVRDRSHHNEVLAKVNKEAMRAIVIAQDIPEARRVAIERHAEIMEKFSIDLPIIFYTSSLQSLRHYTLSEQQDDQRAWLENQKVCSPRKPTSKENVLTIYSKALNKNNWQLGLFGSRTHIDNKPVPNTVAFIVKVFTNADQSEKSGNFNCTWEEAEQQIQNILEEKTSQRSFFKLVKGRSDDTVSFFNELKEIIPKNR